MAGMPDQALVLLEDGFRRIPVETAFLTKQSLIHLLIGEPDKTREKLQVYTTLEPTDLALVNRCRSMSFLYEGRIDEAVALLSRDIQRLEDTGDKENEVLTRFDLSKIFLEQEKFDQALGELGTIEKLSEEARRGFFNPWPFLVDYFSGLCFLGKGEVGQARTAASDLQAQIEKSGEIKYSFLLNGLKAELELAQGNAQGARVLIEKEPFSQRLWFPRTRVLQARIDAKRLRRTEALDLIAKTYNFMLLSGSNEGGNLFDFLLERSKLDYTKAKMLEDFGESAEAVRFYEKAIFNWRNADRDYVNLVDAETRLAGLKKKVGK
jgi:tetratricopeptide (TPR) repeat protein